MEHIEAAWKVDNNSVTLKAMPHVISAHVRPNSFEKMKVNLAFTLFSDEVLKGLFIYKERLPWNPDAVAPTEDLVKRVSQLISVMTSRHSRNGLRPSSKSVAELEAFLMFLDDWEQSAKEAGGGFISKSTAEGLRVTICSTLSLLKYVTSLGFKYLMTSRLSQDKLENLFGIVRQYSGTNDHPSPAQFLVTVNCLTFYNLARPPKSGNSPGELVNALLNSSSAAQGNTIFGIRDIVEDMLEVGNIDEAGFALQSSLNPDHSSYAVESSDSRLVFYMAGYVARKFTRKHCCEQCGSALTVSREEAGCNVNSEFTRCFDKGGLLYPCAELAKLVSLLEEAFTFFFSSGKLHAFSVFDFMQFVSSLKLQKVGCKVHQKELTAKIVQFFVLTRLHFFTKSLNKERADRRERQKLLKVRRCK